MGESWISHDSQKAENYLGLSVLQQARESQLSLHFSVRHLDKCAKNYHNGQSEKNSMKKHHQLQLRMSPKVDFPLC